jgi:signal transduction histidine kinase
MAELLQEAGRLRAAAQVRTRIHLVGREGREWALALPDEGNLLFDSLKRSPVAPAEAASGHRGLSTSALVHVGGTVLALVFTAPASAFVTATEQSLAPLVLLGGLLISLLLFSLLRSFEAAQKQLRMSVTERTRDLAAVNRVLEEEVGERNRLEREVFNLNVEERNQFGRELREGLGRELREIAAALDAFSETLASRGAAVRTEAQAIGGHVRTASEQAELLASGLNPVAVVPGGFLAALERLAAETVAAFQVDCRISHDGSALPQDTVLLHDLYRIAQQAVTNAVTHGRATRINVEVSCRRSIFRLAILDNGVGWKDAVNGPGDGIGLATMRHRCAVLGLGFHAEIAPRLGGAAIIIEQIQASE